jgi:hypothetical protein
MTPDQNELLDLLKFELRFLEDGGYGRSPHTPWRRQLAFQDSLTCPNFGDPARPHPCSECRLMKFVPREMRDQASPCRLIPLTDQGETIDYFYRCGTQLELEEALSAWLRKQIGELEAPRESERSTGASEGMDRLRQQQWLVLAGNLRALANLHRNYQDFGVARALLGRALAAAEKVAELSDAGRAQVERIRKDQQAVYEALCGGKNVEHAPSEEFEKVGQYPSLPRGAVVLDANA